MIFSFGTGHAAATTWNVNNKTSNSIGNAISNAHAGDTLNLSEGTYHEHSLIVNKNLTITGPTYTGTPTAVIDAKQIGRVFNITSGANVTLKNLLIQNEMSYNDYYYQAMCGGAIYNDGTLKINSSILTGNTAYYSGSGGAIYNDGSLTVNNSTFTNNTAGIQGGGGAIANCKGNLTVTDSIFTNNSGILGGGAISSSGTLNITHSTFIGCNSNASGSAILNGGNSTVKDSTFKNQTSKFGGAISNSGNLNLSNSILKGNTSPRAAAIDNGGNLNIYNTIFTGNTVTDSDGAIYNGKGNLNVTNCTFNNNTAINNLGGAISNDGTLNIKSTIFTGNTADYGGAINNYNIGTLNINSTIFTGNTATGMYGDGGAILNRGSLKVTDSNFTNNNAKGIGGAIENYYGIANLTRSIFTTNTAYHGGAIDNNINSTLNVTSNIFKNNTAADYGATIYNSATASIRFNQLISNEYYEIYNDVGYMDAMYNWWGTNFAGTSPLTAGRINNINASSWIVLSINTPYTILPNVNSTVTADLRHDSNGIYHTPANGYILNGIKVNFLTTLGSIIAKSYTINGSAQSTLNGGLNLGVAIVSAIIDSQTVNNSVFVDNPPTVKIIDPAKNAMINHTSKVITITFSEPIKQGSAYNNIRVTNSGGIKVSILGNIKGNILTLTRSSGSYVDGTIYIITIPINAVIDNTGIGLPVIYTSKFTIDTLSPKVTKIDPANNSMINNTSKIITITFSEPIKTGSTYNNIRVTNSGGIKVSILGNIKGNILTLTRSSGSYVDGTTYIITMPTNAVTDIAGNGLATTYTSKFTIDTTPPTVKIINPTKNAVNIPVNQLINVYFSESIKTGNGLIEFKTSDGTAIPFTKSITGNMLTIKPTALLPKGTKYTLILHTGSVTDLTGNPLAFYTSNFTTRTT